MHTTPQEAGAGRPRGIRFDLTGIATGGDTGLRAAQAGFHQRARTARRIARGIRPDV